MKLQLFNDSLLPAENSGNGMTSFFTNPLALNNGAAGFLFIEEEV